MPTLVRDEAGQFFVDEGGGTYTPVTPEQAQRFQGGQGAASGAFQAAGQGLENLITGAGSLLSDAPYWDQANQAGREQSDALNLANPITSGAAQYAPQLGVGLATAGLGVAGTAGVEALLGAATTPEAPIQGALIGGLGGAAGAALPGAIQAGVRQGRELAGGLPWFKSANPLEDIPPAPGFARPGERAPIVETGAAPDAAGVAPAPGAAPTSPSASPPFQPANPAPRMADRVTAQMEAADVPPGQQLSGYRVMEGTMSPEQLYELGIPTSPAQRALLKARGGAEGAAARDLLAKEEATMSSAMWGGGQRQIRDAQVQGTTNFITRELGLEHPDINLTDPVLADVFSNVGGRMDQIAQEMGSVPITNEIKTDFADILSQTTGSHKAQLQALADEIVKKADLNGGALTGDDWGQMRTKINKMMDAGQRQGNIGKISDAGELMRTMTDAMESGLPDATKLELDKLRKQYAIAMTLSKPGARNADGQINPVSFYNNWKRNQSKKRMGTDDVGNFMNTIVTLTKKRTPDSGTAGRLLQNAAEMGMDFVPGGSAVRRVLSR